MNASEKGNGVRFHLIHDFVLLCEQFLWSSWKSLQVVRLTSLSSETGTDASERRIHCVVCFCRDKSSRLVMEDAICRMVSRISEREACGCE